MGLAQLAQEDLPLSVVLVMVISIWIHPFQNVSTHARLVIGPVYLIILVYTVRALVMNVCILVALFLVRHAF